MSERSSRSNVSVLLVHIDIFKIQYTSRGFELGCEDVKEGGGGLRGRRNEVRYRDAVAFTNQKTGKRRVYKEITLLMKYKYKVKYVIFVLDGGQTSSTDGQGQ